MKSFVEVFCENITDVQDADLIYKHLPNDTYFIPGPTDLLWINDTVAIYQCVNGTTHVSGSLTHICQMDTTWSDQYDLPKCHGW